MAPLLKPAVLPPVPSITGYPQIDTAVRNGILVLAAGGTAAMVTWMNAKGWNTSIVETFAPYVIATTLAAVATFIWAQVAKNKLMIALVQHVVDAANTGTVPDEVKAQATPAQAAQIAASGK